MTNPTIDQQVTFLYTDNLERASKFYEETLELPLILDQGGCRIYRIFKDVFLGFCQRPGINTNKDGIIYTFVTEDVDQWYAFLEERGVELLKAPEVNPNYNIYHFFFRDPSGYMFEVQKFLDPRWPGKEPMSDD